MPRHPLFLLCAVTAIGCPWRFEPPQESAPPDSLPPGETGPETGPDSTDTQRPPGDWFGVADYGLIMVPDGTRIEETFGDETTWGEGYSDAHEGPTAEIMADIRAELYPQGAIAKPAYATGITITLPGHVDMALGKRTPHGHHPASANLPGQYRPELPTMWEHLRDQDASIDADKVGFTGNTLHLQAINYSLYPGLGADKPGSYMFVDSSGGNDTSAQPSDDPTCIAQVVANIEAGWRLQLVNLHQIDRAGHYGEGTYVPSIMMVDDDLTNLWNQTVQGNSDLADRTVMAIVSDHGRHRFDEADPPAWRHHGDGCSGCREVPLMLLGPGVRQGVEVDGPYTLEDVGATVAWLMGIHMPYATGMVMTEMLEGEPVIPQRSGAHAVHSDGGLLAYQSWRDDASSRSEIVVDGTTFGNTAAIHVEQPKVLAADDADYACWREVTVATEEDFWNWQAVCKIRQDGGDWESMGDPVADLVWPFWDPALAVDTSGSLHMAWSGNINGNAQAGTGVYLARWSAEGGWEGGDDYTGDAYFPVHPGLALDDDGDAWVAWSAGSSDGQGRYTRHVDVYKVSWPQDEDQVWEHSFASTNSDASGTTYERIDDAALAIIDGDVHVAYHAVNGSGTHLLSTSLAGGEGSWSSVHASDDSGNVYMHVRPTWSDDGWLYWGRLGGHGESEVCRAHTSAMTDETCAGTGAAYMESLAPYGDGVQVTTSSGDKQWSLTQVDF